MNLNSNTVFVYGGPFAACLHKLCERCPGLLPLLYSCLSSIVVALGLPRSKAKACCEVVMANATQTNLVTRVSVAVASTVGQCNKTHAYNINSLT